MIRPELARNRAEQALVRAFRLKLGVTKRTARWYLAQTTPIPSAALLCLGDARLRAPLSAPIHQIVARMLQDRTG
jgi:hypothetical protein